METLRPVLEAGSAERSFRSERADALDAFGMVGASPPFRALIGHIQKVAACGSSAPVLIEGDTGTGKELAARAIHYLGPRRDRPFAPLNCGALPENLIESELFGHVRGAYTDARQARSGLIAQAEGGTLFLDEIDALTPKAQVSLLRFLQDYRYRPVGQDGERGGDVRVIAAGNQPLAGLVARGLFDSRARAQAAISAGRVTVDGRVVAKPSEAVDADALITAEAALWARLNEATRALSRKPLL